ncbi:MAG: hypothetical protein JWP80_3140 [Pseudomonas sp.]|nr:hypothetical protein [Pseudomonas sp.]
MTDFQLADEWIPDLIDLFAVFTGQTKYLPSLVSLREQRAREHADRTIEAFSERFTEKGFFPQDDEGLVLALLPQLPDWPADLAIWLLNEYDELIGSWTKGVGSTVIGRSITLVLLSDGEYAGLGDTPQSVNDPEAFFQRVLRLLPADLRLGTGGNFPGADSIAGRIVTLREQIAELVRTNRAQLFDALLADDAEIKNRLDIRHPNPFWPFWKPEPTDRSPVVDRLLRYYPEIFPARFEALLKQSPLSDALAQSFLEEDELPDSFIDALEQSTDEWRMDRGLDGLFHTRTYNPGTDVLARKFSEDLLKERFGYALIITEPWHSHYVPSGPDDTAIVLVHEGRGKYGLQDLRNGGINRFKAGTDSFYQAIGSGLQPHERLALGMLSETDVKGLRTTLGNLAATANGGWFDPENHIGVKNDLLPQWMKEATVSDKLLWSQAREAYLQALVEAQAPGLPDIVEYGSREHLLGYARTQLEQRLELDLGLTLNPDDIIVETTESKWVGNWEGPPTSSFGGPRVGDGKFEYTTTQRSLTQICLENLRVEDLSFWLTARFLDSNDRPIMELGKNYVHGLIRELNVGDSYVQFLRQRLLTSSFGQWCRDRYAQIMATQMRLDAIEAKMAMDYLEDGKSPPHQADRGYKWVRAVLDHPLDDGNRALVEGHRIRVQTITLRYNMSGREPGFVNHPEGAVFDDGSVGGLSRPAGILLEGLLIIAPESRQSVPGMVIYTPSAPDGVCFREFSSQEEMEHHLLGGNDLRDYLVGRAPVELQAQVRRALDDVTLRNALVFTAQPPLADDLYFTHYEGEVERVIARVDDQTTSTSEANWSSAWNIASALAELALEFAPFRVRLPIAAARSLYALWQAGGALREGDAIAGVHFAQAVLLLTDGLPGAKKLKTRPSTSLTLDPKLALSTTPNGLKLRSDGSYNGVYEKSNVAGFSDFYVQQSGRAFPVTYDAGFATWRIIDPRRPDAFYRAPIRFDGQEQWTYGPVGLRGGGRDKLPKGAKASKKPDKSTPTSSKPRGRPERKFDTDEFYQSKEFREAEAEFGPDTRKIIEAAVDDAKVGFTSGNLHKYREGKDLKTLTKKFEKSIAAENPNKKPNIWSLDLTGLGGGGGGRGKWRLILNLGDNGTFQALGVIDPH